MTPTKPYTPRLLPPTASSRIPPPPNPPDHPCPHEPGKARPRPIPAEPTNHASPGCNGCNPHAGQDRHDRGSDAPVAMLPDRLPTGQPRQSGTHRSASGQCLETTSSPAASASEIPITRRQVQMQCRWSVTTTMASISKGGIDGQHEGIAQHHRPLGRRQNGAAPSVKTVKKKVPRGECASVLHDEVSGYAFANPTSAKSARLSPGIAVISCRALPAGSSFVASSTFSSASVEWSSLAACGHQPWDIPCRKGY